MEFGTHLLFRLWADIPNILNICKDAYFSYMAFGLYSTLAANSEKEKDS
jgi:hypothetical protein